MHCMSNAYLAEELSQGYNREGFGKLPITER